MSLKSVKTLSATQLAKKWNLSLGEVGKLITQGAAVEKEHTKNEKEAREVARDHLAERPDYYKKLKKVEKSPISMKEGISAGPEREVDHTIGDLTGSSRKVMKVDEVKISPKIRKAAAVGMTAANLATGASVYDNASRGVGSPVRDIAAAASGLPGKVGYAAMGTNYTIKGFDKAREHLRAKMKKKIEEATFQGKKVPLNKPMKGDVKKSKVYVDPDGDGKAQKVNFGDPNMTIKKSNPARRKSFRARHNCDNPGPKTKARYWSCKAWEETEIKEAARVRFLGRMNPAHWPPRPDDYKPGEFGSNLAKKGGLKYPGKKKVSKPIKDEPINEISAELVGKVSNARFFRGEAPSKVLTRAINKKFIESGKKKKEDKKEVKEAVMAMPPQVSPPAIVGQVRPGVRVAPRPTETSGRAAGRMSSQSGSMSARPNVRVSSGVQPSIERSWRTPGRGTMGTSGGSMSATPKVSTAYSQGGVNVGKAMGASKQTSPVVKGMTSAGREAAAVVSKAAPVASRVAGAALRVAGGPAATAAAAVMSPTAANAGEDEKKRQATLKDYNPYKPSGRSVADYEKQVGLTKPSVNTSQSQGSTANVDTPKGGSIGANVGRTTAPKVDAPQPPSRPEYFTRGQAFQAARGEAGGAGAKFSYGGSEYQTNVKGEPYSNKPKQTSVTDIKETKMDTKDLINEALDDILENNLVSMKENLMAALQEKAMEKIEEKKKEIASNYFAQ